MSETEPTSGGRREQFEEEIAAVRIRTGKAEAEQRFMILGLVALLGGPVICLIGYFASKGMSDSRDIYTMMILALFGISLSIVGAAIFLRYSMARFLRFWLLRLIYEQQDHTR
jgi:predicted acyltransferase